MVIELLIPLIAIRLRLLPQPVIESASFSRTLPAFDGPLFHIAESLLESRAFLGHFGVDDGNQFGRRSVSFNVSAYLNFAANLSENRSLILSGKD
jgi:hypothetical protein